MLYIDLLLCIFIIGGFYFSREYFNHGYLKAVWENELGGRYLATNENHNSDFLFYYTMLADHHYSEWLWLFPCGIAAGFFFNDQKIKKITLYVF